MLSEWYSEKQETHKELTREKLRVVWEVYI